MIPLSVTLVRHIYPIPTKTKYWLGIYTRFQLRQNIFIRICYCCAFLTTHFKQPLEMTETKGLKQTRRRDIPSIVMMDRTCSTLRTSSSTTVKITSTARTAPAKNITFLPAPERTVHLQNNSTTYFYFFCNWTMLHTLVMPWYVFRFFSVFFNVE